MKILVTGGAGYIGSITVKRLLKEGHEVVVFDNLVYGHKEAVSCKLIQGDLVDKDYLFSSLKGEQFDAVIHFAAYALAGESMKDPHKYFSNNILGGLNLLEYMVNKKIPYIIFSSTCAIYGTPKILPVTELTEKHPESVYGESKLMFENILFWYETIYQIKHINLRYFNAAGASLDGALGEEHNPETHIIPLAIKVALGKQNEFVLNGNDYDTPDGTAIRDYIHVEDLASAHILALKMLRETNKSDTLNLGAGKGYSNIEVVDTVKEISGKNFPITIAPRRAGDPPIIFADSTKAKNILKFIPQYSDLHTIVKSAWMWHQKK